MAVAAAVLAQQQSARSASPAPPALRAAVAGADADTARTRDERHGARRDVGGVHRHGASSATGSASQTIANAASAARPALSPSTKHGEGARRLDAITGRARRTQRRRPRRRPSATTLASHHGPPHRHRARKRAPVKLVTEGEVQRPDDEPGTSFSGGERQGRRSVTEHRGAPWSQRQAANPRRRSRRTARRCRTFAAHARRAVRSRRAPPCTAHQHERRRHRDPAPRRSPRRSPVSSTPWRDVRRRHARRRPESRRTAQQRHAPRATGLAGRAPLAISARTPATAALPASARKPAADQRTCGSGNASGAGQTCGDTVHR